MAKGFGKEKPFPLALHCSSNSAAEFDRLMAAYQRQGLGQKDALQMVGVSSLMCSLREAGFNDGADFGHSQEEGLWLSAAALQHVEKAAPPGTFDRYARQGLIRPREQTNEPS